MAVEKGATFYEAKEKSIYNLQKATEQIFPTSDKFFF